ncbi:MAG: nucleotidyltransferase family protein [Chloroflexi bacterium]|nr:nucleotidyltransferase family protein [Chloroflexota bacterium]
MNGKGDKAPVSAIVLAAGESKRMGRPKLLLPFGGGTIMEQAIDTLLDSRVSEVIVVVGHNAREIVRAIGTRPVKVAVNELYRQGMSTSIVKGLSAADEKAVAMMIVLADQPLTDSQTVNKLIEEFLSHDRGIAVPVCLGQRGHPVILSLRYRDELLALKGDVGGREIVGQHPDDVLEVAVDCQGVNVDIDTWQDYLKALPQAGSKPATD